jgi:hypothetical protein
MPGGGHDFPHNHQRTPRRMAGVTFRVFVLVPAAILALATLAGSGAASEAGPLWMVARDICVIAAMQAGYIGGSALFVAVAD